MTPRLNQSVGSQDHLPAVAVQAFPVEEEAGEGDENPPQPSGLSHLLNIFSSGTPKPANSAPTALCCAAKRT